MDSYVRKIDRNKWLFTSIFLYIGTKISHGYIFMVYPIVKRKGTTYYDPRYFNVIFRWRIVSNYK